MPTLNKITELLNMFIVHVKENSIDIQNKKIGLISIDNESICVSAIFDEIPVMEYSFIIDGSKNPKSDDFIIDKFKSIGIQEIYISNISTNISNAELLTRFKNSIVF